MLDRTVPFYNTILRCDHYRVKAMALPEGYPVVTYQPGFEKAWAALECSVGDFDSAGEETFPALLHLNLLLQDSLSQERSSRT